MGGSGGHRWQHGWSLGAELHVWEFNSQYIRATGSRNFPLLRWECAWVSFSSIQIQASLLSTLCQLGSRTEAGVSSTTR